MKTLPLLFRALMIGALLVVASIPTFAGSTTEFPGEKPALVLTVPDGWTNTVDKDGLNVYPDDKSVLFLVAKEEGTDNKATVEAFLEGLKKGGKVTDVTAKSKEDDVNGMKGYSFELTGKDKDGDPVMVSYIVFNPTATSGPYSIFFYANPEGMKKNMDGMKAFIKSIKAKS